jgi:hypothetical protein
MEPLAKIGEGNMSGRFPIQNGPQQDHTSSSLPFKFALEYAIKNVKVNRNDKLNGVHQLQTNADDVNLFRSNINKTKKSTEDLLISGDGGLKANADKTKFICVINRMQNKNISHK